MDEARQFQREGDADGFVNCVQLIMLTHAVTPGAWEAGTAGANYTGGPLDFPPVNSFELAAAMVTSPSPTKTPDSYVTHREPLQVATGASFRGRPRRSRFRGISSLTTSAPKR